jgi:hypothetical protein
MYFERDVEKAKENFAKHDIDFEHAIRIFDGPTVEGEDWPARLWGNPDVGSWRVRSASRHRDLHHARRCLPHHFRPKGLEA